MAKIRARCLRKKNLAIVELRKAKKLTRKNKIRSARIDVIDTIGILNRTIHCLEGPKPRPKPRPKPKPKPTPKPKHRCRRGPVGPRGPRGFRGLRGFKGSSGPTGRTGARGAAGVTGAAGVRGATGIGMDGVVLFDPLAAPGYRAGQVVTYNGSTYVVNITGPVGTPGTSPDYTLLAASGATGATGATGAGTKGATGATGATGTGLGGLVAFDPLVSPMYPVGQVVTFDGSTYVVNTTPPTGIPGTSPDYTLLAAGGSTGATGAVGATGATGVAGVTGATGVAGVAGVTGATGGTGATGATGAAGATGTTGAAGATGVTGDVGATGATGEAGATGATGAAGITGATGTGLDGIVTFDPLVSPTYPVGQVVTFDGSTYVVNTAPPTGTPSTSPDYTLLAASGATGATGAVGVTGATGVAGDTGATGVTGDVGATGATGVAGATGATGAVGTTGATGAGLDGIVAFDPLVAPTYPVGQVVTFDGSTYVVNTAPPTGTPGTSPDYTLLAASGAMGATGAVGATGATGVAGDTGPTGATGVAGATGATGAVGTTGATGTGLDGIVAFDPLVSPTYPVGQVVTFDGSTYVVNTEQPTGTPGTSPDYTLLAAGGATGATGAVGATGATGVAGDTGATGETGTGLDGIVAFDPLVAPTYPVGQVVTFDGSTYVVNTAQPTGTPGTSPDYTLLAASGATGATGAVGATGATGVAGDTGPTGATGTGLDGIVTFDPLVSPTYPVGQVVTFDGSTYVVNTAQPTGTPGTSPDYTLLAASGATGATGAVGATGATGVAGDTGPTGATGTAGATGATGVAGATGATGTAGATGATGATGTSVTSDSAYAANTTGALITVVIGGTNVPLPSSQNLSPNITVNGANDTFTVANAGRYYISYQVNTTAALLLSTRLIINGTQNTASVVAPALSISSFTNDIIVTLGAASTVTLQLFGLLGAATLITGGAGAALTIIRVS
ncbi:hypothetical protein FHS15_005000 [Paenibacillus castaneae]|uniref:BclA C-terminal domain-containing protein n=1 Tax=Paenibacillus castaneae TaxID=474957 RepID=UPI001ABB5D0E|nr:hypothetical protein [Paenibacillus castaneae]NIK79833.1 hypothetical protein [Paenibacillus castaneae]